MSLEARLSFHPIIFNLSPALPLSLSKVNRSTEGHSLLQVGDWTFVADQPEDGFAVTLSRESDKILVDGAARCDADKHKKMECQFIMRRGNVEQSLEIVRNMLIFNFVGPRVSPRFSINQ